MQLKRYVAPARRRPQSPRAVTVEPGTVNHHGQLVVRKAGRAADDLPGQNLYVLKCSRCANEYAEAGLRVHARKCPRCGDGRPALPVPAAGQATLFD